MKPQELQPQSHPKALEHPTGLPNSQPNQDPPAPGSFQAPIALKPDSWGSEQMPRTTKLLQSNQQCHANSATNTLQAHGTTMHKKVSPWAPATN